MPIAFKEWAVTVRALAEGEQLVTLRKGGIREERKHFEVQHDRFFLYPTFEHQRNDVVRASHQPELRRALEEGVWPDAEPPAQALTRDGGIPQPDRVRIRAWAEVAASYLITDPRCVDALSLEGVVRISFAHYNDDAEVEMPAGRDLLGVELPARLEGVRDSPSQLHDGRPRDLTEAPARRVRGDDRRQRLRGGIRL